MILTITCLFIFCLFETWQTFRFLGFSFISLFGWTWFQTIWGTNQWHAWYVNCYLQYKKKNMFYYVYKSFFSRCLISVESKWKFWTSNLLNFKGSNSKSFLNLICEFEFWTWQCLLIWLKFEHSFGQIQFEPRLRSRKTELWGFRWVRCSVLEEKMRFKVRFFWMFEIQPNYEALPSSMFDLMNETKNRVHVQSSKVQKVRNSEFSVRLNTRVCLCLLFVV